MMESSEEFMNIQICEVGPRDGLQSEKRIWSVAERVELINQLTQAGVKRIEAASFVNPKRVPQMANAEAVMAEIDRPSDVRVAGLALNMRGIERALDAGVDEVRYVVVASETFNLKNQGASIDETLRGLEGIAKRVIESGRLLSGTIGASFGCPFEGNTSTDAVVQIARRYEQIGVHEVMLADTIGCAVPSQVRNLISVVRAELSETIGLGCHFHNTRNTGIANAVAAVEAGVQILDSSVGGIGGCPFAPRATGNIATEDLCYVLRNMGYDIGIDLAKLVDVAKWAEGFFDEPLPGQVMKAGLFPDDVLAKIAA
jgi:isopropylmalate/homocitrate/citramalate synthase